MGLIHKRKKIPLVGYFMPICKKCNSFVEETLSECPFCGENIIQETSTTENIDEELTQQSINQEITQKPGIIGVKSPDDKEYVLRSPELESLEMQEYEEQDIPMTLDKVPQRNYLVWLALGIISVGIVFLIYLYLNLEDLEKHSRYPNELKAKPIEVNASSMLTLFIISICFSFIPILWYIYYKKYASLYYHLKEQNYETAPNKIVHPAFYMVPLILSHLSALVPAIISLTTSINIRVEYPLIFWLIFALVAILSIINITLDYFWQRAFNEHTRIAMINIGMMNQEI